LVRTLGSTVSAYGGGLKVVRVRPGSLAASRSIQPGDILIGIHDWQTTSESDLDYVMQQPEMYRGARKFYIGRSGQIMEGEVQLASRNTTSRRISR
jgi:serine protease Do